MIRIAGFPRHERFDNPPEPVRPDRLRSHNHYSIEIRGLVCIPVVFVVLNEREYEDAARTGLTCQGIPGGPEIRLPSQSPAGGDGTDRGLACQPLEYGSPATT